MGTEASPADLAAFTKVREDIDQRNRQRLFYLLFPDEDVTEPDGSVSRDLGLNVGSPPHTRHGAEGC